ncbi:MAG: ferredoxin-type protein NapF [Halieaceae bacterium]|nr:ferredoxin-type protein NapF [Halieaceae bacterium]
MKFASVPSLALSRTQLLRGRTSAPLRPPWAISENLFIERCTRCNQCVDGCDLKLLKKGQGGFPEVDFSLGGCTFCEQCIASCDTDVLSQDVAQPWQTSASIGTSCLSNANIECRNCGDECASGAINFTLTPRRAAVPTLDSTLCNGCGACVANCPVAAIEVIHL